ncbi:RecQ family zinc-binding domain-containing protein, partial [Staphylococcus aureus]|nr:RecQ family zinc-binding domain-containing protein [Staphylococcus aureus]
SSTAKQAVLDSTEKLRGYANDLSCCRWASLLSLLAEDEWTRTGRSCGLCDNCVAAKVHEVCPPHVHDRACPPPVEKNSTTAH